MTKQTFDRILQLSQVTLMYTESIVREALLQEGEDDRLSRMLNEALVRIERTAKSLQNIQEVTERNALAEDLAE